VNEGGAEPIQSVQHHLLLLLVLPLLVLPLLVPGAAAPELCNILA
jgi:hypothetical protein